LNFFSTLEQKNLRNRHKNSRAEVKKSFNNEEFCLKNEYSVEDIPMIDVDFTATLIRVSGKKIEGIIFLSPLLFLIKLFRCSSQRQRHVRVLCHIWETREICI